MKIISPGTSTAFLSSSLQRCNCSTVTSNSAAIFSNVSPGFTVTYFELLMERTSCLAEMEVTMVGVVTVVGLVATIDGYVFNLSYVYNLYCSMIWIKRSAYDG